MIINVSEYVRLVNGWMRNIARMCISDERVKILILLYQ